MVIRVVNCSACNSSTHTMDDVYFGPETVPYSFRMSADGIRGAFRTICRNDPRRQLNKLELTAPYQ